MVSARSTTATAPHGAENHELTATDGAVHDHGSAGTFVSRLVIERPRSMSSGSDLIQDVHLPTRHGRLRQADRLQPLLFGRRRDSAFFNRNGAGYRAGTFSQRRGPGVEAAPLPHRQRPRGGSSYGWLWLGNAAFESVVANSNTGDTTRCMMDDGQNGRPTGARSRPPATPSSRPAHRRSLPASMSTTPPPPTTSNAANLAAIFSHVFHGRSRDVSARPGRDRCCQRTASVTSFLRPEDSRGTPRRATASTS